jgi:HTH-type transcriptional regulator, sugar sensing transcriptional regulator
VIRFFLLPESNDNELSPVLKEMGLSTYESKVWGTLLRRGQADAQTLTREADVPFGRIYEVLNALIRKRIVEVQNTRPKQYRPKRTKEVLDRLVDSKKREMQAGLRRLEEAAERVKRQLEHIDRILPKDEIFVSVALSPQEIEDLGREAVYSAENEIFVAKNPVGVPQKLGGTFDENTRLLAEKASHGVTVKLMFAESITRPTKIFGSVAEKAGKGLFQVRVFPGTINRFSVIDRRYVLYHITDPYEPEAGIVLIKLFSKKLAEHMGQVFLNCWRNSTSFQEQERRVLTSR